MNGETARAPMPKVFPGPVSTSRGSSAIIPSRDGISVQCPGVRPACGVAMTANAQQHQKSKGLQATPSSNRVQSGGTDTGTKFADDILQWQQQQVLPAASRTSAVSLRKKPARADAEKFSNSLAQQFRGFNPTRRAVVATNTLEQQQNNARVVDFAHQHQNMMFKSNQMQSSGSDPRTEFASDILQQQQQQQFHQQQHHHQQQRQAVLQRVGGIGYLVGDLGATQPALGHFNMMRNHNNMTVHRQWPGAWSGGDIVVARNPPHPPPRPGTKEHEIARMILGHQQRMYGEGRSVPELHGVQNPRAQAPAERSQGFDAQPLRQQPPSKAGGGGGSSSNAIGPRRLQQGGPRTAYAIFCEWMIFELEARKHCSPMFAVPENAMARIREQWLKLPSMAKAGYERQAALENSGRVDAMTGRGRSAAPADALNFSAPPPPQAVPTFASHAPLPQQHNKHTVERLRSDPALFFSMPHAAALLGMQPRTDLFFGIENAGKMRRVEQAPLVATLATPAAALFTASLGAEIEKNSGSELPAKKQRQLVKDDDAVSGSGGGCRRNNKAGGTKKRRRCPTKSAAAAPKKATEPPHEPKAKKKRKDAVAPPEKSKSKSNGGAASKKRGRHARPKPRLDDAPESNTAGRSAVDTADTPISAENRPQPPYLTPAYMASMRRFIAQLCGQRPNLDINRRMDEVSQIAAFDELAHTRGSWARFDAAGDGSSRGANAKEGGLDSHPRCWHDATTGIYMEEQTGAMCSLHATNTLLGQHNLTGTPDMVRLLEASLNRLQISHSVDEGRLEGHMDQQTVVCLCRNLGIFAVSINIDDFACLHPHYRVDDPVLPAAHNEIAGGGGASVTATRVLRKRTPKIPASNESDRARQPKRNELLDYLRRQRRFIVGRPPTQIRDGHFVTVHVKGGEASSPTQWVLIDSMESGPVPFRSLHALVKSQFEKTSVSEAMPVIIVPAAPSAELLRSLTSERSMMCGLETASRWLSRAAECASAFPDDNSAGTKPARGARHKKSAAMDRHQLENLRAGHPPGEGSDDALSALVSAMETSVAVLRDGNNAVAGAATSGGDTVRPPTPSELAGAFLSRADLLLILADRHAAAVNGLKTSSVIQLLRGNRSPEEFGLEHQMFLEFLERLHQGNPSAVQNLVEGEFAPYILKRIGDAERRVVDVLVRASRVLEADGLIDRVRRCAAEKYTESADLTAEEVMSSARYTARIQHDAIEHVMSIITKPVGGGDSGHGHPVLTALQLKTLTGTVTSMVQAPSLRRGTRKRRHI